MHSTEQDAETTVGTAVVRDDRPRPVVVVGVDASDSARHAADWAADLASAWRAPLHLVHAAVREDTAEPAWLRELRDAAERTGVEQVESRLVAGPAADELVRCSQGAGMVVVGSYGEGARSGMDAGSVALTILEAAACPTAVVRGAAPGLAPPRSGPVVVGTDAAAAGDPALHLGATLADTLGCRLHVLHAWSDVVEDASGVHRTSDAEQAAHAAQRLDEVLAPLREAYPSLPIEQRVVGDTALRALLGPAQDARMLVVGHRRGPRARGRMGSTSRSLVAFASCPVVVA